MFFTGVFASLNSHVNSLTDNIPPLLTLHSSHSFSLLFSRKFSLTVFVIFHFLFVRVILSPSSMFFHFSVTPVSSTPPSPFLLYFHHFTVIAFFSLVIFTVPSPPFSSIHPSYTCFPSLVSLHSLIHILLHHPLFTL